MSEDKQLDKLLDKLVVVTIELNIELKELKRRLEDMEKKFRSRE